MKSAKMPKILLAMKKSIQNTKYLTTNSIKIYKKKNINKFAKAMQPIYIPPLREEMLHFTSFYIYLEFIGSILFGCVSPISVSFSIVHNNNNIFTYKLSVQTYFDTFFLLQYLLMSVISHWVLFNVTFCEWMVECQTQQIKLVEIAFTINCCVSNSKVVVLYCIYHL